MDRYIRIFQSNIQENKDWNNGWSNSSTNIIDFQSNIQENKDWNFDCLNYTCLVKKLSEQHPREQGLKHIVEPYTTFFFATFQSNIQENKDWNQKSRVWDWCMLMVFQSNIQENKDWNFTRHKSCSEQYNLSEQHPREQRLKRWSAWMGR